MQVTYKAPYWYVYYNGKKYVSKSKDHAIKKALNKTK